MDGTHACFQFKQIIAPRFEYKFNVSAGLKI